MSAIRLLASVVFSGDCKPNDPGAAAIALARHGYEVSLLANHYRRQLIVENDDFLEATKFFVAGDGDVQGLIDGVWAEVSGLAEQYGGDVVEVSEAAEHIPFEGFHTGRWI